MLDDKKWVKINKFPDSVGKIYGIYEINNVFYVVGEEGILTLNNEFYKFPSYKNYYWYTSCLVGNNILLIREKYDRDLESKLFNTINKQWSNENIKTRRREFDVVNYLNKVWIVGGEERNDDGKYKILNTIQIYDPVNKTTSLSPVKMIQARKDHKVIVYNNKLFVFGGVNKFNYFNTVEMYSPDTNKFITMAPMETSHHRITCCRVGDLVYVIGGTNFVEIYNLDTNVWCDGTYIPVMTMLSHACAVNNKLEQSKHKNFT